MKMLFPRERFSEILININKLITNSILSSNLDILLLLNLKQKLFEPLHLFLEMLEHGKIEYQLQMNLIPFHICVKVNNSKCNCKYILPHYDFLILYGLCFSNFKQISQHSIRFEYNVLYLFLSQCINFQVCSHFHQVCRNL